MKTAKNIVTDSSLPFYRAVAGEVSLFEHAFNNQLPLLIKGPTGCGKTRFVQHMAARLGRPLYTVACHDDLTASDLVGRHLIGDSGTYWSDGPLTRAVREGAICYLDEIVEARKDTTVVIHALTDHRRMLTIDKLGQSIVAHPDFLLVVSYNPGYQSVLKDLKQSTRQRFVAIAFDYLDADDEARVVVHEGGVGMDEARRLVSLGRKIRHIREHGRNHIAERTRPLAGIFRGLYERCARLGLHRAAATRYNLHTVSLRRGARRF